MNFYVFHFSDLHFGKFNAAHDEQLKKNYSNFFFNLKTTIKKQLETRNVKLIIISGDYCSANDFGESSVEINNSIFIPHDLIEFFKIFSENKTPIIISIGNHEINQKQQDYSARVSLFLTVKENLNQYLSSNFSNDYKNNLINYVVFNEEKKIFFSSDSTFSLSEQGNWDNPNLDLEKIQKFFDELSKKEQIKVEKYNKYLIIHHALNDIQNNRSILNALIEMNIHTVFSGHHHEKNCDILPIIGSDEVIHNFIAGSPLLSKKRRDETNDWNPKDLQFNCYKFSKSSTKIPDQACYFRYNENGLWEPKLLKNFKLFQDKADLIKCGIFSYHKKPKGEELDFYLDLSNFFCRNRLRLPQIIQKRVQKLKMKIYDNTSYRSIIFHSRIHLSLGLLIGYSFRSTTGFDVSVKQGDEIWNLNKKGSDINWTITKEINPEIQNNEFIIIINVSMYDTLTPVKEFLKKEQLKYQNILYLNFKSNEITSMDVISLINQMTNFFNQEIINSAKNHLFLTGPLGLFTLLGTKLNVLIPAQIYEWDKEKKTYYPTFILK